MQSLRKTETLETILVSWPRTMLYLLLEVEPYFIILVAKSDKHFRNNKWEQIFSMTVAIWKG